MGRYVKINGELVPIAGIGGGGQDTNFKGKSIADWEALTQEEQDQYDTVDLTDDYTDLTGEIDELNTEIQTLTNQVSTKATVKSIRVKANSTGVLALSASPYLAGTVATVSDALTLVAGIGYAYGSVRNKINVLISSSSISITASSSALAIECVNKLSIPVDFYVMQ